VRACTHTHTCACVCCLFVYIFMAHLMMPAAAQTTQQGTLALIINKMEMIKTDRQSWPNLMYCDTRLTDRLGGNSIKTSGLHTKI